MPLVRINIAQSASSEVVRAVSDAVYEAMHEVANVPANDKFQIITRHAPDELVYPAEGYLGIDYTPGIVFIQVTWSAGRTTETKKAFYRAVADGIHAKAGLRREAEQGRDFGFDGKMLIHPAQIDPVNEIFVPSAGEVAFASKILGVFEAPENADKGVVQIDGQMVERLHLDVARRTLALIEAAGE